MASQSSVDQLARAWRPMRKLRRKNFVPLFRGGTPHRTSFLAMWQRFPWQVAIAYWIFVSFLIIGTFIDFEHFHYSGPRNNRRNNRGRGLQRCCSSFDADRFTRGSRCSRRAGAALGYVILWIVLEAGRLLLAENASSSTGRRRSLG
jgi:hypothetical protein